MPQTLIMWIHLMAAIAWIGGMLFRFFVVGPVLKGLAHPAQRSEIQNRLETRFRKIRWSSLVILIGTGMVNLIHEGGSTRLESGWGGILLLKLLFVAIVIALSGIYDFGLSPDLGRTPTDPSGRSAYWLSNVILAVSLLIVFIAVYLAQT
ncbi:MAG: DUF4149 domain-containing protein [Nitrospirae bacterium]|nr:DUF4149 domain-containing protein [Nitrospirota bacterium]